MMKVYNEFGDKFRITAMLNYNIQKTTSPNGPGTITNADRFWPRSRYRVLHRAQRHGDTHVPQVNPFFAAPAGSPDATQETVSWLALRDDGNYGYGESEADSIYATFVAEYDLSDSWTREVQRCVRPEPLRAEHDRRFLQFLRPAGVERHRPGQRQHDDDATLPARM